MVSQVCGGGVLDLQSWMKILSRFSDGKEKRFKIVPSTHN